MDGPDPALIALIMELRQQGVTDARVLDAMERTPRAAFLAPEQAEQAYENRPLPIGWNQTVSQPFIVGLMTHRLELADRMRVLEIGTGSGYQTAILAKLALRVYTVERNRPLLKQAEQRFQRMGIANVTTRLGDGALGWPEQAPFDRILVTAAAPEMPQALVEQLKPGGVMLIPVGEAGRSQLLLRVTKESSGLKVDDLGFVGFVPLLPGIAREE